MRRAPDPSILRCEHGYDREAACRDCPRCADRPVVVLPAVPQLPRTRWYATDTTLGPFAKVAITLVIVVPLLDMTYRLHFARTQPVFAFLILPIAGFTLIAVRLLPDLWEPGRLRHNDPRIEKEAPLGDEVDAPN